MDKRIQLCKGFGFVSNDSSVATKDTIHWMNGFLVDDRLLVVELKRPKAPRRDCRSLSVLRNVRDDYLFRLSPVSDGRTEPGG